MSDRIFGIFDNFWDGHPNHLPFLDLYESQDDPEEWNLQLSLNKLESILTKNSLEDVIAGLNLLLKSDNWRPHLIACLVILKSKVFQENGFKIALWERLKSGSWVSPQILVVLSIIDEDFEDKIRNIIDNGFKVVLKPMSPEEHHTARGGSSSLMAERKIIEAAQYLLNGPSSEYDEGGGIAASWKERLLELIEERRISIEK